jgi:preprotein translocase subunit SecG
MAVAYVLIFIVCALLIIVVLIQNSKGGGLASGFTGSQIMGVRKTADFLEKATWTLAGTLLLFCIIANLILPRQQEGMQKSVLQDEVKNAISPASSPKAPTVPVSMPRDENQQQAPAKQKK